MTPNSNNTNPVSQPTVGRGAIVIAVAIMWIAVTGYFIGLNSPMSGPAAAASRDPLSPSIADGADRDTERGDTESGDADRGDEDSAIEATSYLKIAAAQVGPNRGLETQLAALKQEQFPPSESIAPQLERKPAALAARAALRAFNGAPPTVPHTIDQMSDKACMSCHKDGLRSASIRAAKMPHPYYINCTQCHIESAAKTFAVAEFRDNAFQGLNAPLAGERASPQAPPATPHSTWLRNDCLSCHGRTAHAGMRTSHPERRQCLQCHPTSAQLNQTNLDFAPEFLPPLMIEGGE